MSLEGLEFILNKREVVPTVSARDLIERAEQVDADYKRHVRTYVPISRAAEGDNKQLNVEQFERRVIKRVKEARAPRGYLTAEYGYGKTSTALYLWDRAEQANLVVVPPFQMLHLPDLITAIHGWVRYRLASRQPELIDKADQLYADTTSTSIQKAAQESNANEATIRKWVRDGRFILDLQTADYLHYFEKITGIVQEAGFEGLIVLPDEIQQYIEPQMKSSGGDPIAPFFNLIQGLATREGHLCFGFIMVIPLKEIGVIREARGRGDLLDRMRELSLDLSTVYGQDFATRLWEKLSHEFNFADVAADIVRPETLDALGEIASRDDLSNGPRTVINTFRRMVQNYLSHGHAKVHPYTPINLVDDLLTGAIQFSGNNQIQNVTRRALQSAVVRAHAEQYEPAIKLAAAFPNDGAPLSIQKIYKVDGPLDELMHTSLGDLVIAVGPIDLRGVTLVGLDRVQLQREWLPQTIREFRRAYTETHNDTRDRALQVFDLLLKTRVFKNWKLADEQPSTLTSNRSLIFEGDFQSFSARFPQRRVHVRVLWEDEPRKDPNINGDVLIEYRLSIHRDLEQDQRRNFTQPIELQFEQNTAIIWINLMYVRPEGVAQQIQQGLQGVWSPYDLSPLVLMNIYQMLEEKRASGLIPKHDDQYIQPGFQPDLLDNIMRDLFNPEIGAPLGVAGERITELSVERILDARYGHTYQTIMAVSSWKSSLQKYWAALDRLENRYQKHGDIAFEGSKDDVAGLLVLSNTGLDSFMRTFGFLLKLERDWPSQRQQEKGDTGAVRFTLHPQETEILQWLSASGQPKQIPLGKKTYEVRCLELGDVYQRSREQGYLDEETEQLLQLLGKRELTEIVQNHLLCELPSQAPDVEGVSSQLSALEHDVEVLLNGFPKHNNLISLRDDCGNWRRTIEEQLKTGKLDPKIVYRIGQNIRRRQSELVNLADNERRNALKQLDTMLKGLRPVNHEYLIQLERPISGMVSYVDQVNALRLALFKDAQSVRSEVEKLHSSILQSQEILKRDNLRFEDIASYVQNLEPQQQQLGAVNKLVSDFEQDFQHLNAWRQLVQQGSVLFSDLSQMESVAKAESDEFDLLSRQIRGDISSSRIKKDVLPNHSIYEARLGEISAKVQELRDKAINLFNERQNFYRNALTASGLYRREQLSQPFEYNFSNPGESNRLLEDDVQKLVRQVCDQIEQITTRERHNIMNTLGTPYLKDIPQRDSESIVRQGEELLNAIGELVENLQQSSTQTQDIHTIRDTSRFSELIRSLEQDKNLIRDISRQAQRLGNWLIEFELTPEQAALLTHLSVEDLETTEDLIEWRSRIPCSDDEFWFNLRGLYEKRRIRLSVGRVRLHE